MADDESLTQRERRAQRNRGARIKNAPMDWRRQWKTAQPILIVLLILAGGVGAYLWLTSGPTCPDHWHGTQAVFVPVGQPGPTGYDTYIRMDWNGPKTAAGTEYYNYGTDPKMSPSVHMHQSGPEQGSAALGPAQFHFEGGGKCVGIQNAFSAVDLDVAPGHIATVADSPLAKSNPGGPWNDHGNQSLHFFLESKENGHWVWHERDFADYEHYQMQDGESILLAFGHFSDSQIQEMMNQVPAPSSRPPADPADPWQPSQTMATTTSGSQTSADTTTPTGNGTA